jgi:hypothetical protein
LPLLFRFSSAIPALCPCLPKAWRLGVEAGIQTFISGEAIMYDVIELRDFVL